MPSISVGWDWNEPLYVVMSEHETGVMDMVRGVTKNKELAERLAKELDGWVDESKWIREWV